MYLLSLEFCLLCSCHQLKAETAASDNTDDAVEVRRNNYVNTLRIFLLNAIFFHVFVFDSTPTAPTVQLTTSNAGFLRRL